MLQRFKPLGTRQNWAGHLLLVLNDLNFHSSIAAHVGSYPEWLISRRWGPRLKGGEKLRFRQSMMIQNQLLVIRILSVLRSAMNPHNECGDKTKHNNMTVALRIKWSSSSLS